MSGSKKVEVEASENWISASRIINICSEEFNTPYALLFSSSRKRYLNTSRATTMYFIRMFTGLTFSAIGTKFNRHHSTVMHNLKAATDLYQTDKEYREKFECIKEKLELL